MNIDTCLCVTQCHNNAIITYFTPIFSTYLNVWDLNEPNLLNFTYFIIKNNNLLGYGVQTSSSNRNCRQTELYVLFHCKE